MVQFKLIYHCQDDGTCIVHDGARLFYNDLPEQEQKHWASKLHPQAVASFHKPLTYEGHKHHPATYLLCTDDQMLPLEIQKAFISSSGIEIATESCDAGHSPWLSQPNVVLDVIKKVAGEIRGDL